MNSAKPDFPSDSAAVHAGDGENADSASHDANSKPVSTLHAPGGGAGLAAAATEGASSAEDRVANGMFENVGGSVSDKTRAATAAHCMAYMPMCAIGLNTGAV